MGGLSDKHRCQNRRLGNSRGRGVKAGWNTYVRTTKRQVRLPIGRTARIAFEIDVMRSECCKAAQQLTSDGRLLEKELEECARLDDALAEAHRVLKVAVRGVMIGRLRRRAKGKS